MTAIYRLGFITSMFAPVIYFSVNYYDRIPDNSKWKFYAFIGVLIVLIIIFKLLKGAYDRKIEAAEHLKMAKKPNYGLKLHHLKGFRSIYVMLWVGLFALFMYLLAMFANEIQKVLIVILVCFAVGFIFEYLAEKNEDIKE